MKILNIVTCWEKQPDRIKRIRNSWGQDEDLLFISHITNNQLGIIGFNTPDGYKNIVYSHLSLFRNFDKYLDYDWYTLDDSDSYVFIERIKNFVKKYNSDDELCIGRIGSYNNNLYAEEIPLPLKYPDGSCIILSKGAIKKLINYVRNEKVFICDAVDVALGAWLNACNIKMIDIGDIIKHGNPFNDGYSDLDLAYHMCFDNEFNFLNQVDYREFIVGEKFYSVADFIYSNDEKIDYNKLNNTFDKNNLKEINIVYFHTMYRDYLFDSISNLNKKFILISHNSDDNVDSVSNLPNNVIKWFSQNINIRDSRLESLPIGLENGKWFPEVRKQRKILKKINTDKKYYNMVYMNHNVNTNNDRKNIYNILKDKNFVTVNMSSNGQNYENYIDNIYNHRFVICPQGNGIDTHRTWETLYLKSIPIEKRNINNQYYTDLPICFVDDWNEITEDFLNREYERIINTKWNLDKLKMSYWIEKIKNYNENR